MLCKNLTVIIYVIHSFNNNLFSTENEKYVKMLIQNGATINIKDEDGNEPLQLAINTGITYDNKIIEII